eukprot:SAG22_NODE_3940_length_1459_cov_1.130147_1_plen_154_part_10
MIQPTVAADCDVVDQCVQVQRQPGDVACRSRAVELELHLDFLPPDALLRDLELLVLVPDRVVRCHHHRDLAVALPVRRERGRPEVVNLRAKRLLGQLRPIQLDLQRDAAVRTRPPCVDAALREIADNFRKVNGESGVRPSAVLCHAEKFDLRTA